MLRTINSYTKPEHTMSKKKALHYTPRDAYWMNVLLRLHNKGRVSWITGDDLRAIDQAFDTSVRPASIVEVILKFQAQHPKY